MMRRDLPGIYRHNQAFRRLHTSEERLYFLDLWSKTTVETHHQQWGRVARLCRRISLDNLLQLHRRQRQWFFDKDMFAYLQSATHEVCVAVMTCRDHHNVDRCVRQQARNIRSCCLKTEFAPCLCRAD